MARHNTKPPLASLLVQSGRCPVGCSIRILLRNARYFESWVRGEEVWRLTDSKEKSYPVCTTDKEIRHSLSGCRAT